MTPVLKLPAITLTTAAALACFAPSQGGSGLGGASLVPVVPRAIDYPLPGTGDVEFLADFDQARDFAHDMVLQRGGNVFLFNNTDGLAWPVELATSVDVTGVMQSSTARWIMAIRNGGSSELLAFRETTGLSSRGLTVPWSNIVRIEALERSGALFWIVAEDASGNLEVGAVNTGGAGIAAISAIATHTISGTLTGWTLADFDNNGSTDIVTTVTDPGTGGILVEGHGLVSGASLGTVLYPTATAAHVIASHAGANNEVIVVRNEASDVRVTSIVGGVGSADYVTDWTGWAPAGSYTVLDAVAGDIDDEGAGGYDDVVLQVPTAAGRYAFALLRNTTNTSFYHGGRRILDRAGCSVGDDGLSTCSDSNNSVALGINSGADFHTVATRGSDYSLVIVTGINLATTTPPATSQFNTLWTSEDYTDFILGGREGSTPYEIDLQVAFNTEYFQNLGPAAGTVLEIRVWKHNTQTLPDFDTPVENDTVYWQAFDITQAIADQAPRSLTLPVAETPRTRDNTKQYYVEAMFHTITPSHEVEQRAPTHVFGFTFESSIGNNDWHIQLRAIASSGVDPEDETRIPGVVKDPGFGVKKPDALGPVPPLQPRVVGNPLPPVVLPNYQ